MSRDQDVKDIAVLVAVRVLLVLLTEGFARAIRVWNEGIQPIQKAYDEGRNLTQEERLAVTNAIKETGARLEAVDPT